MSLRTLIRLLVTGLVSMPLSVLLWGLVGPWPLLAGVGLLLLTCGYLALLAGEGDLTRWQLRYQMDAEDNLEHLENVLRFLAAKAGRFTVEANAAGLFLELPSGLDRYVEAHLPKALPELRLSRKESCRDPVREGSFFLCISAPSSDLLRWATEGNDRQVRLHIHQGPYATFTAQTVDAYPPGHWLRLPRLLRKMWYRLPVWDELSSGTRVSHLFPPAGDGAVYSSRSRLLQLIPPDDYHPNEGERDLGQAVDDRPLTLNRNIPLLTVGAPPSFLVQQALSDLETRRSVVVVSPHRRVLEQIERKAGDAPIYWLDPQNSRRSAHLPIVSAGEWEQVRVEAIVGVTQTLLSRLGLDVELPTVGAFTRRLIHVLATSARQAGLDFSFIDLYAVSQGTPALRAFLADVQGVAGEPGVQLLADLGDDTGYVQGVTLLSAIRTALKPLGAGPLHALCQPPFLNAREALRRNCLLLVPMTNVDFPEHDRLLSAMLDLTLNRVLAAGDDLPMTLHLHDFHLYRTDRSRQWIEAARQDSRLSLLLDVQDPDAYSQVRDEQQESQVIFRWSESIAATVIGEWGLPASTAELTELPTGTGIARLPGMVVTLKVSKE